MLRYFLFLSSFFLLAVSHGTVYDKRKEEWIGEEAHMKLFLYRLCQCTWGLPQTVLGLLEFWKHREERHYSYRGAIVTECKCNLNISLGMFVFITEEKTNSGSSGISRVLAHEYGHTIQSLFLGPLYLLVIGVPSWLWCNLPCFRRLRKQKNISYYSLYTEKWADRLGGISTR